MPKPRFSADVFMTRAAAELHDRAAILAPWEQAPVILTIFVSCYNEETFIVPTLDTVREAMMEVPNVSYEIIVIDDVSRDSSPGLVERYIETHPDDRIILRRNKVNRGLAQNYFDGAFIGKGKYYRLICGDNAEPKETIVAVFREIGAAEIIIPYYVSTEGKGKYRNALSATYSWLINFISGFRLHYYNGLAVHLRYNVMRWHPNTRGFGFQADILCMLLDQGYTFKEVPVTTIERRHSGHSNALTFKNFLSVAHTMIDIIIRRISNQIYQPRQQ